MNSLSENESLLRLPLWANPYLVAAITLSMALHFAILYIPVFTVSPIRSLIKIYTTSFHSFLAGPSNLYTFICFQSLFAITPLNWAEWKAVLIISFPVIIIDEVLKFISVSTSSLFRLQTQKKMLHSIFFIKLILMRHLSFFLYRLLSLVDQQKSGSSLSRWVSLNRSRLPFFVCLFSYIVILQTNV